MKRQVTVVVADPAAIFRSALRSALRHDDTFRVLEAKDYDELLEIAASRRIDIVLLDIDLPPHGGLAAASSLSEQFGVHPVLWSLDPEQLDVLAGIRAGAAGYLPKEIPSAALVRALHKFLAGEAPLTRRLALTMVEGIHTLEARKRLEERLTVVSPREREVLKLLVAGLTNKQIAAKLVVSPATAKRHVQNLLNKLQLPSREEAASFYSLLLERGGSATEGRRSEPRPGRPDRRR